MQLLQNFLYHFKEASKVHNYNHFSILDYRFNDFVNSGHIRFIMKILITGANGLLGQYAVKLFAGAGHEVMATGRGGCRLPDLGKSYQYTDLDITDKKGVSLYVTAVRPEVIVHAAAMAQPDACELNREVCYDSNTNATLYFTEAAEAVSAKVL